MYALLKTICIHAGGKIGVGHILHDNMTVCDYRGNAWCRRRDSKISPEFGNLLIMFHKILVTCKLFTV